MKKAAIMLYPMFSMQEISCLTELFKFDDKEIVTFSADGKPVKSEDGFTILPDRPFEEFCRDEVDCLVLPGIWEPLPVLLDGRNLRFLEQFQGDENLVIGSISSSPLLLGKAGLLTGRRFCHGVFEEFIDAFPVLPREGVVRAKLVEDGSLVTACGEAFREFAAAVARKVGLDYPDTVFTGVAGRNFTEEECTYRLPPEMLEEARADWERCLREAEKFFEKPIDLDAASWSIFIGRR